MTRRETLVICMLRCGLLGYNRLSFELRRTKGSQVASGLSNRCHTILQSLPCPRTNESCLPSTIRLIHPKGREMSVFLRLFQKVGQLSGRLFRRARLFLLVPACCIQLAILSTEITKGVSKSVDQMKNQVLGVLTQPLSCEGLHYLEMTW